jgi:tRNA-dihydrouridine synthase
VKPDFWPTLPRPFFCLAPMEDVTDTAFREIVLQEAAPDCLHVVFTEFTSTDGLCHPKGRARVAQRLLVNESERRLLRERGGKLVAQIWGNNPEKFRRVAKLLREEYDFDGIDINMGCPVKEVVRRGSCAALIGEPTLAREIVLATREEADGPVSVKTRTGLAEHITERWIGNLLEVAPAAIILHGRTQKAMSKIPADWEEVARAVRLRDAMGSSTVIAGNGAASSLPDARAKAAASGAAGVMVGRGIFRDPWFFRDVPPDATREERLDLLWRHTALFASTWTGIKNFPILKKFYKVYASGFADAAELRVRLMAAGSADDVRALLGR